MTDYYSDLGVQVVRLDTSNGNQIEAWWFPPPSDTAPVIIFCHGNAGDLRGRADEGISWGKRGIGMLLFDYQGYGASEGTASEENLYADALAAYKYLHDKKQIPDTRIIIFGRSLGGGVASYLASQKPHAGLILARSFTSLVDRAKERYPFLPISLIARNRFMTNERLDKIPGPVLVIHGDQDEIIGFHHGQTLAKLLGDKAETYWVEGAGHNNLIGKTGSAYFDRVEEFIRKSTR